MSRCYKSQCLDCQGWLTSDGEIEQGVKVVTTAFSMAIGTERHLYNNPSHKIQVERATDEEIAAYQKLVKPQ
jgi:hypothetical protein